MKGKVGILSLGCPRNLVDSESILGRLKNKGYSLVDINKAQVAIVNTCAFIEDAKRESVDALLDVIDLKKRGRLKKIIIYRCLSQRYHKELLKELPQIDAFVGRISLDHDAGRVSITPRHYAYLKICEGCINSCSFCAIPRIKGKFSSLDISSIVRKARALNRQGVRELNIIGQDISGYGIDLYKTPKLTGILKKLIKVTSGVKWIRLLYLYPSRVTDDLIKTIRDEPKICKYIDLPVQHINNRILNLMRRQTKKEDILRLVDKIRKQIPQAAIRTSLIVGFPSESDKEFQELLEFIKEVKFERLGAFIYSREEGTKASRFPGQVPKETKMARFNAVMSCQQQISREVNQGFLSESIDVLIDERAGENCSVNRDNSSVYLGRSQYDAPEVDGLVYVKSKRQLQAGDFVRVRITDSWEYDLIGEAA